MTDVRLAGKVAVLIGGSGAIGRATADRLANRGARAVLTYHRQGAKTEAFAKTLPGGPHWAFPADVADSASLAALALEVAAREGRADILVNLAGFTRAIPHHDLDALDDGLFDEILTVGVRGVFASVRAFRPLLDASGDGLVVNISSIAGMTGQGSNVAYCAAKAGVDVMGKSLARALAPGIRVMTVSPGVIDTGFVPGRGADFNEKAAGTIPIGRIGTAGDVADAICACATDLRYATGNILTIDGGRAL